MKLALTNATVFTAVDEEALTEATVVGVDPGESTGIVVSSMKGRDGAVDVCEIRHQGANSPVPGVVEQVPVQGCVVAPFVVLAELPSHEEQLLAGHREHVRVEQPEVGE